MARLFTASTSNRLEATSVGLIGGWPCTFFCWFKLSSATARGCLMSVATTASALSYFRLSHTGDTSDTFLWRARGATGGEIVSQTTGTVTDTTTWHTIAGETSSASAHKTYLDGVADGSTGSTLVAFSPDNVTIGHRYQSSTRDQAFDGAIAYPTVWAGVLTADDHAALYAGAHPFTIKPDKIRASWAFSGSGSETCLTDLSADPLLSLTGTVAATEGPMVSWPWMYNWSRQEAGAPAARPQGPLGHPFRGAFGGPI